MITTADYRNEMRNVWSAKESTWITLVQTVE